MMSLDDLFAAAKRSGIGVLVIQSLHIGDVVTAETIVSGDVNNTTTTTNTLSVPREMLPQPIRPDHSVACAPLDPWVGGYYAGLRKRDDDDYFARIANGTLWSK